MKSTIKLILQTGLLLFPLFVVAEDLLRVAITTTTENTAIAQVLNAAFTEQTGVRVQTIALGSGQALRTAKNGDVDVVMTHAPTLEQAFIDEGWVIERSPVMHNDFVILGPDNDPAGVRGSSMAAAAFRKIAESEQRFISRGDDSGTHIKEKTLWQLAELAPAGNWYIPAGSGMGMTLIMADNLQAYTLSDRGTYLAFQDKLSLSLLFEGDEIMYNPYHIMIVNPEKHPHVKLALAKQYVDFITGEAGQQIITGFLIKGERPFLSGVGDVDDTDK